jgi:hypothetical protein
MMAIKTWFVDMLFVWLFLPFQADVVFCMAVTEWNKSTTSEADRLKTL